MTKRNGTDQIRVALLGAHGSLGRQMYKTLTEAGLWVVTLQSVMRDTVERVRMYGADIVINCAAMTGTKRCEENPSDAYRVNAVLPCELAALSAQYDMPVIHFSTEDAINPVNVYGKSKRAGEHPGLCIYRLPLLYGPTHEKQIVAKLITALMRGETVRASTNFFSPALYSPHLAMAILDRILADRLRPGLINMTGPKMLAMWDIVSDLLTLTGAKGAVQTYRDATVHNTWIMGETLPCGLSEYAEHLRNELLKAA